MGRYTNHVDIPHHIRKDYEKCRKGQLLSFQESLKITHKYNEDNRFQNEFKSPTFSRKKNREELERFQDEEPLRTNVIKKEKRQSTICQDNPSVISNIFDFEKVKSNVLHILKTISDVKFVRLVGEGMHGTIFEVCHPELSSQRFIVKVGATEHEFKMQSVFFSIELAIEPIGYLDQV